MKILVVFSATLWCITSAQLLRADKMNLGVYNPETKHYEKQPQLGQDGHDRQHHGQPLLGQDGHDQQQHGQPRIGGDDHDLRPHGQPLLGGDDHDLLPHGQPLLGGDDHDLRPHGQPLLGGDDHDLLPHGQPLLGGDDHDLRPHGQPLLGGDDHDLQPHGQPLPDIHKTQDNLGGDSHYKRDHKKKHGKHNKHKGRKVLGGDDHDKRPHAKHLLGGDDHDRQPHGRPVLGGDDHDHQSHRRVLGGDDHDHQPHDREMASDKKVHKKRTFGQGIHDHKKHGKKLGGGIHDLTHIGVFKNFMKQYNKSYKSQAEFKKRFNIFRQNMKKVYIFNEKERGSAKYGPTKFADLTEQEFRKMLGFRLDLKPELSSMRPAVVPEDTVLPTAFDWRDKGVVSPVKNQGMCGSCWAFSVTGNVEGQWALKHQHLFSLSEQELVDCDKTDQGCNGGMPENAYEAIKDLGGLETESDYPYDAKDEQCHFNKTMVKVTVNGSVELPQDEVALAKWLIKNGPISIGINANPLQFYIGGVSHPLKFLCNPKDLDHGMLIVGFGVHTTKYLHRKQPYWIIKNSWGADWGEQGYYRVYRGDGTCGVNQMATSAIVP
ncbi:putative cysteine proteinase CG12163 isoform X4 [Homarus americanus]|uniref:putative cysteine proteinase CG12163 isoform X4 n=1 Tax=Homarus americanus TaxID=6706 RepID=UPI001C47EBA2|nr:putative cysteine proteinase CG12163 isoform X4 [Homarus americanus]